MARTVSRRRCDGAYPESRPAEGEHDRTPVRDVVGHIRLYEAGNTYDMPRALAHAAAKRELVAVQQPGRLDAAEHPKAARGVNRIGIG
jgi:hypothetical protein